MILLATLLMTMSRTDAAPCRTRAWAGGPTTTLRAIKSTLDRWPRTDVVQLAWGEMLKKDQAHSLAMPALQYLTGTEATPRVRGYYKTLALAMTRGHRAGEAIKRWPTRMPAARVEYSLGQLCALYRKAGGT